MFNFGAVEVIEQEGLTKMPQEAASAWSAIEKLVGAKYKPIAYVGKQIVKGTNFVFLAEQTLELDKLERHIVAVKVNIYENQSDYLTIERIF